MADDTPSGTRPFGFYDTFAQMLNDLAATKGYHLHSQLARAIDPKATETLEKNVGNWLGGKICPSPSYLKPLAKALDLKPEQMDLWNRLYRKARRNARAQKRTQRPADPPAQEQGKEKTGTDKIPIEPPEIAEPEAPTATQPAPLPESAMGEEIILEGQVEKTITGSRFQQRVWQPFERLCKRFDPIVTVVSGVVALLGAAGFYALVFPTSASKQIPDAVSSCERFAAPPFDVSRVVETSWSDTLAFWRNRPTKLVWTDGGVELIHINPAAATKECNAAVEWARSQNNPALSQQIHFLNTRAELAAHLAKRIEVRRRIIDLLNDAPLHGTVATAESAVAREKLSAAQADDRTVSTTIDQTVGTLRALGAKGYVSARIALLEVEYDDLAGKYADQPATSRRDFDKDLLSQTETLRNDKTKGLADHPSLQRIACGLTLVPFFKEGETLLSSFDAETINRGLTLCKNAYAQGEQQARYLLDVANFYQLPGTANADLPPPARLSRAGRAKSLLDATLKSEVRDYPGVIRNRAWIHSTFPKALTDINSATKAFEDAYTKGRTSALNNLCVIHGLDWAETVEPPAEWENFTIEAQGQLKDSRRVRKMLSFCQLPENENRGSGLFFRAKALASGEAEAFGITRNVPDAARLLLRYMADKNVPNQAERRENAYVRLGELCSLYVRPDLTHGILDRYRTTIETITASRREISTRRDLDTVCGMAADAGNPFSMAWLYLASVGAAEGYAAAPVANTAVLQRLAMGGLEEKNIQVADRPAQRFLEFLCAAYIAPEQVQFHKLPKFSVEQLQKRKISPSAQTAAETEQSDICDAAIAAGSTKFERQ